MAMEAQERTGRAYNGHERPERLATFHGAVSCRRAADVLGLTLCGDTSEAPGEMTALSFSAAAPAAFPETLADPVVERLGEGRYRITSASNEWLIEARSVHLHRDIARPFYQALPPRPVPWAKRALWRLLLALAASRTGLKLLRALRR
jgi:hypothetical protein